MSDVLRTLQEEGMTRQQAWFLSCLSRFRQPTAVSVVAETAGISRPRASIITTSLERRGLLTRLGSQTDLRLTTLQLTEAGAALCARLHSRR